MRDLTLFSSRILLMLVMFFTIWFSQTESAGAEPGIEYQVKAAFIANFLKFIHWPGSTEGNKSAIFPLGVSGTCSLSQAVKTVQGQKVRHKTLAVNPVASGSDLARIQVLVVCPGPEEETQQWISATRRRGVLTIGDSAEFARQGGMVGFYLDRGKVRFAINLRAAQAEGISISSKLLKLAHIVD